MCYGQIVGSKIQTARRAGKPCSICDHNIPPGGEYVMHRVLGNEDGKLSMWKLCKTCAAWWSEANTSDDCPLEWREAMREDARALGFRGFREFVARGWTRLTRHTKGGA